MAHPVLDLDIPETVGGLLNRQTLGRISAVEHAMKAPFYAGKLDHIDIDKVSQPEEWAKVPILGRDDLRGYDAAAFLRDFCVVPGKSVAAYWPLDRDDGTRLFLPRTRRDLQYATVAAKRTLTLAGFAAQDCAQISLSMGFDPVGPLLAQGAMEVDIGAIRAGDAEGAEAQLDLVRALGPTGWIGRASHGIQLGQAARAADVDLPKAKVKKMLCTGEPLSDIRRRHLSDLWGAEVRDCLALPEVMILGCEDAECYGFRVWTDYCYIEILDQETMEPVMEGTPGLMIVTPLVTNQAMPLLRWNTGEVVTLRSRKEKSPFGLFPRVKHMDSRGARVGVAGQRIDLADLEDALIAAREVSDFCAILTAADGGAMELQAEFSAGAARAEAAQRLEGLIFKAFGLRPRVLPAERGSIARRLDSEGNPARVRFVGR